MSAETASGARLFAIGALLALAVGSCATLQRSLLEEIETLKSYRPYDDGVTGPVLARGTVRGAAKTTSRLGRRCIAWRGEFQSQRTTNDARGRRQTRTYVECPEGETGTLDLELATGAIRTVDVGSLPLELAKTHERHEDADLVPKRDCNPAPGNPGRVTYVELCLEPGDPITVLGCASERGLAGCPDRSQDGIYAGAEPKQLLEAARSYHVLALLGGVFLLVVAAAAAYVLDARLLDSRRGRG
ncbi:MAG: hypothetical protein FJ096_17620 [Deltaproteobacteria bacterium]|nr:hypothetical protein [Deltaproteobacteria bacterium]